MRSVFNKDTIARKTVPEALVDRILAEVQSGRLEDGALLPSERDMAVRFGVSRVSVRTALQRMAREGWRVTDGQAGWRLNASALVGKALDPVLFISDPSNQYLAALSTVREVSQRIGIRMETCSFAFKQLVSPELALPVVPQKTIGSYLVFVDGTLRDDFVTALVATGKPVCCIQHQVQRGCDTVAMDRMMGVRSVVKQLTALGHRHLFYVSSRQLETVDPVFAISRAALESECRLAGVRCDALMNEYNCWHRPEDRKLFFDGVKKLERSGSRPTAIYTEVGWTSLPYLTGYLMELGLRVPEDISLIGGDVRPLQHEIAGFGLKPFSGFSMDIPRLVEAAFRKLETRAKEMQTPPSLTLLPPLIVPGETLAALPKKNRTTKDMRSL